MKTKRILLTCFLLLTVGVATGVLAQNSPTPQLPEWPIYTVKNGGFAVSVPILPAVHWQTRYIEGIKKPRRELLFGSYADGVAYVVYVLDNPSPSQPLKDFIAERSGDKVEITDVSRDGFPGKAVRYPQGMAHYFAVADRLYEFRAMGAPLEDPRVARFFSSLSFAKTTNATEAFEGPGLPDPQADIQEEVAQKFYTGKETTRKARLAMKPEPPYTEPARQNQVMGTVVLKAVFSSDGSVKNIKVVSGLPHGLTERAIDAASKIKFIPAQKDGKYVSMLMTLEYNFNLF
jgi:TonB family protein